MAAQGQQFLAARRIPHLRRLVPTRASEVLLIAWWCTDGVILTGEVDTGTGLERAHLIRMILW